MANILVIDDDQGVLQLVKLILSHEGHQVLVAADGFQGLKIARQQRPDLILLDLMLPGIDGFEVCSRLRQDSSTANVPVLIVSAKSQDTDRSAGAKVGANGYLTKPYQRSELLAQIEVFLGKSSPSVSTEAAPSTVTTSTGAVVTLIGARESEVITHVVVNTAVALAGTGARVTLADLRPFSVEQSLQLGLTPRVDPLDLNQTEAAAIQSAELAAHASGLRLLNNLEGSGEAGQLTAADVSAVLGDLLPRMDYTLLSLPLYPIELLREVAARSRLMAVVAPADPAGLAATRSALNLLDRLGVPDAQIGLITIGSAAPDLGRTILATLPAAADAGDPAYGALAARLREQCKGTAG
ncbi:MAG: response regulator [Chloroflexi bacterium]|nr:response regulator [Chloroflexota bacterium]